jgi:signal transduction histidine kinase
MGENEISVFFLSVSIVLLILFITIFFIIIIYRKRKIEHDAEKEKLAERHQQELVKTKTELQASIMKQIGAELHDTINQRLTLAYLHTGNMQKLQDAASLRTAAREVGAVILLALEETRSISKILSAEDFSAFGLCGFVEKELYRVQQAGICIAEFEMKGIAPVFANEKTELVLARICQEFIQNSLKHAAANSLSITIDNEGTRLVIICRDDGRGFEYGAVPRTGQGLENIKNRAAMIEAGLNWQTEPGKGTTLIITL